ncbi:hypothetical protein [Micromonospora pattaloongensis]|nr:hypothetical protein [Micromonospora pattaloongensis]
MSDPYANAQATMPVQRHTFLLADEAVCGPRIPLDRSNGLIDTQPGLAVIFTGILGGNVRLAVQARPAAPAVDTAEWDEVVDVTLDAPTGAVRVRAVDSDDPDGLPVLTPAGPGPYRVRVHARGRDTAVDEVQPQPVEDYLIAMWPEAPAPVTVHKQTDGYGALLRRSLPVMR